MKRSFFSINMDLRLLSIGLTINLLTEIRCLSKAFGQICSPILA